MNWDAVLGVDWVDRTRWGINNMETMGLPDWLKDYEQVFQSRETGLPPRREGVDHAIVLKEPEPKPSPLIPTKPEEQQFIKDYLDDLLHKGWIRPSKSPCGASLFLVPKKGGLRPVIDYRKLNEITVTDSTPLPLIDDTMDQIQGNTVFSKIDLKDAFNQIRIKEGDEWKTAFRTRYGTFEYLVMPFGLVNAPGTFQRYANQVLKEELDQGSTIYMDDIFIMDKEATEHRKRTRRILGKLQEAGLQAKLSKCEFEKPEIEILGRIINKEGVRPSPEHLQTIREWKTPTKVKEVQAFVGFANYQRKHVPGLAEETEILTRLTKKGQKWQWGPQEEKAFQEIKKRVSESRLIRHFDPNLPLTMETDASDHTTAAVLSQENGPLAFMSKKMTAAEQNYGITEKEMLAIVQGIKQWRKYFEGTRRTATIITDHKNLEYFKNAKITNRRQARWALEMQDIPYQIQYRSGKENTQADALTRREDATEPLPPKHIFEHAELTMEQAKEKGFHPQLNVAEAEKKPDGWYYRGRKILGERNEQEKALRDNHDSPTAGHPGVKETLRRIKQKYYWDKMIGDIKQYVQECMKCQQEREYHKKGIEHEIGRSEKIWKEVSIDHITKLPKTRGKDSILVIKDQGSGMIHLKAVTEKKNAKEVWQDCWETAWKLHGTPEKIRTDRGSTFMSKEWEGFMKEANIQHDKPTAYHSKSNGLVERANREVRRYLRKYINHQQDDWDRWLPTLEFAYNARPQEELDFSPYQIVFGETPEVTAKKEMRREAQRTIETRQATKEDARGNPAPEYQKGQWVFLGAKNKRKDRPSQKLDHKYWGPFQVEEKTTGNTYKLKLPKSMKIHPVFNTDRLKPYYGNAPTEQEANPEVVEGVEEWEVEEIRKKEGNKFLIKWRGFSRPTWEPKQNLTHCDEAIRKWEQKQRTEK